MKTKSEIWKQAYDVAWNKRFNALDAADQEDVKLRPESSPAANRIARDAWSDADQAVCMEGWRQHGPEAVSE